MIPPGDWRIRWGGSKCAARTVTFVAIGTTCQVCCGRPPPELVWSEGVLGRSFVFPCIAGGWPRPRSCDLIVAQKQVHPTRRVFDRSIRGVGLNQYKLLTRAPPRWDFWGPIAALLIPRIRGRLWMTAVGGGLVRRCPKRWCPLLLGEQIRSPLDGVDEALRSSSYHNPSRELAQYAHLSPARLSVAHPRRGGGEADDPSTRSRLPIMAAEKADAVGCRDVQRSPREAVRWRREGAATPPPSSPSNPLVPSQRHDLIASFGSTGSKRGAIPGGHECGKDQGTLRRPPSDLLLAPWQPGSLQLVRLPRFPTAERDQQWTLLGHAIRFLGAEICDRPALRGHRCLL